MSIKTVLKLIESSPIMTEKMFSENYGIKSNNGENWTQFWLLILIFYHFNFIFLA